MRPTFDAAYEFYFLKSKYLRIQTLLIVKYSNTQKQFLLQPNAFMYNIYFKILIRCLIL
jgi:hypothetical protein